MTRQLQIILLVQRENRSWFINSATSIPFQRACEETANYKMIELFQTSVYQLKDDQLVFHYLRINDLKQILLDRWKKSQPFTRVPEREKKHISSSYNIHTFL